MGARGVACFCWFSAFLACVNTNPSVRPLWWKAYRPRVRSRSESPKVPSGHVKVSLSVAKFDRFEDLEDQVEEIPCRDVHLARCLQFAMHKFRLSLFVKDLEPGGSTIFCFLIV